MIDMLDYLDHPPRPSFRTIVLCIVYCVCERVATLYIWTFLR